ncbi:hypothetical protein B0P06_004303 [Clostridium saccharoperbutylacetonicum]|uniref:Uncharacterized protein n=1 Tax=Clostridium saccharoperbutylacetonicum N1-4(HMT) TaxID=931276 RepID=M1MRM4_9CLOT|nr:hypothetical protein [Clostridium saccharoperbutylacetonicum]AGF57401.1 hypothetical protein Cspa_c36410 [Clostridium saccharoperbutylacetonicum N1-4(HMT)]NRT61835.1 hypothetical protein [Clostridium saccharoperbutylacetonicum]NSB25161.1 hypothetical protein [Clostridium saccharoperbutylacetonicum]NSB44532.1 hypothetical protein [Clostridium saccharoperbutylacetonicum]
MSKLTIARYKEGYIGISDYNKDIHKNGEIFCPFCNPPLEVTGVENDFFRALPGREGHNCGRRVVKYFDADWAGRKLIETLGGENGEVKVIIDINSLEKIGKDLHKMKKPQKPDEDCSKDEIEIYNRYTTYKKVLRDVVRTVIQMKNFIEKNSIDNLNKIKFVYKMGTEELRINEVVKLIDEIDPSLHNKVKFIIYKVESVKIRDGKIYINSYETEWINLAVSFAYPSKTNKTGIKKDDIVIAFGTVSYYRPKNKYYLNILNDLNIVKTDDEALKKLFESKEITKKDINKYSTKNKITDNIEKDEIKININSMIVPQTIASIKHEQNENNKLESVSIDNIKQPIIEESNDKDKKKTGFLKTAIIGLSKLFGK